MPMPPAVSAVAAVSDVPLRPSRKKAAPSTPGVQQRANQARQQQQQQQTRPQQAPQQRPSMMRSVLTGLAAALGISALLSMLGLGGAEMASLVMGAILAVVAFFAIRFLLGAFLGRKTATVRGASVEMPREPVRPAEPRTRARTRYALRPLNRCVRSPFAAAA
mgnify:CR=1 FL=1